MPVSELVSICIPAYNAERWIDACVRSALDQTHPNTEVIVVDDGSTDATWERLQAFADNVRLIRTPNQGGNPARNSLLNEARGTWIQYLDADDYLLPDKISAQLRHASDPAEADALFSPVTVEHWENDRRTSSNTEMFDAAESPTRLWLRWRLAQTASVLWRAESLRKINGWNEDYPCCQDNEVTMRALQHGLRFQYVPEGLGTVYRYWEAQTVSTKNIERVLLTKTKLIIEMLDWLRQKNLCLPEHTRTAHETLFGLCRMYAYHDLPRAAEHAEHLRAQNLLHPIGPSAPLIYRLSYHLLGFSGAEKLARLRHPR